MPKVSLLYVTFRRDLEFLDYSLQSFRKYCKGFAGVTIVVPTVDIDAFLPFEKKYGTPECPVLIKNFLEFPGKGFVHHLAMACYADVFNPSADYTLHLDPDCLWIKPTTPDDYFVTCCDSSTDIYNKDLEYQKPVLLVEPFEAILQAGHVGRYGWKKVVEDALRFEVTHETMCRHPAVHYRKLYPMVRKLIEIAHCCPFTDYVLKQKNSFPQGFAEFPTMGAVAMKYFYNDYHFIDRGFDGERKDPKPHLEQLWSYRLKDGVYNERIKEILA